MPGRAASVRWGTAATFARHCGRRYDPDFMADQLTASNVFVHPQALCESSAVGENSRIWAFAHVLPGARIGKDCNICDHVFIENDVVIGDRVTIKCGVQLWDGLRVADDVFIGPNVTFSNDKYPKSKQYQPKVEETHIGRGASIGGGASVLPGLRIGARAMVGAGAVVTHDVPARAVVSGNPARIVGYVDAKRPSGDRVASLPPSEPSNQRHLSRGRIRPSPADVCRSSRKPFGRRVPPAGSLRAQGYFVVYDVPGKDVRGEHAHRRCRQFLICLRGSLSVVVDDGRSSEEIVLDQPSVGLYLPPMVWAVQYRYSTDAMLLVFASEHYDATDYIRDYDEFLSALGGTASAG